MGKPKLPPKDQQVQFASRIRRKYADELLFYAGILKEKGIISQDNVYSITKFALLSLLKTLRAKYLEDYSSKKNK